MLHKGVCCPGNLNNDYFSKSITSSKPTGYRKTEMLIIDTIYSYTKNHQISSLYVTRLNLLNYLRISTTVILTIWDKKMTGPDGQMLLGLNENISNLGLMSILVSWSHYHYDHNNLDLSHFNVLNEIVITISISFTQYWTAEICYFLWLLGLIITTSKQINGEINCNTITIKTFIERFTKYKKYTLSTASICICVVLSRLETKCRKTMFSYVI